MITGVYGTSGEEITVIVTTEEKRIDTSVSKTQIRLLFKFTNDMTKEVKYAYGQEQMIKDRYTQLEFYQYGLDSVFLGRVDFKPFGFWKYEIYEVSYNGTVPTMSASNTPQTEPDTADTPTGIYGTVKGKVEEGKLYIQEKAGEEQVKYTKHTTTETNYLYTN